MLMYYVYVLKNKETSKLCVDYTKDLKRRLSEHKEQAPSVELVHYEAYVYERQARNRERKLKLNGSAWRGLKRMLEL
ncbi:MAG: GIY-YIG nuclease family protein [bacterium]